MMNWRKVLWVVLVVVGVVGLVWGSGWLERNPQTPGGAAERKFMQIGMRFGRMLNDAYEQGRAEERQEQERDLVAGGEE